jgi:hypothetical protein
MCNKEVGIVGSIATPCYLSLTHCRIHKTASNGENNLANNNDNKNNSIHFAAKLWAYGIFFLETGDCLLEKSQDFYTLDKNMFPFNQPQHILKAVSLGSQKSMHTSSVTQASSPSTPFHNYHDGISVIPCDKLPMSYISWHLPDE